MKYPQLVAGISAISILQGAKKCSAVVAMQKMLRSIETTAEEFFTAYSEYVLIVSEKNLCTAIEDAILLDDNPFTRNMAHSAEQFPTAIAEAVVFDLEVLGELCSVQASEVLERVAMRFGSMLAMIKKLPRFNDCNSFTMATVADIHAFYKENGYGAFATGVSFYFSPDGARLSPAPDTIRLCDLKGYQRQKAVITENTLSFLQGNPANNILMYGDKGTGKSSTVKAVVNEYADKGLKIIELKPEHSSNFPQLYTEIAKSPFKFIVLLDDIGFSEQNEAFMSIKAFIEGGVTAKPSNMLIYATSNRRHMVKEKFSERVGDDVHIRDALESSASLSDRFGIEITFQSPDKSEYLYIVSELAKECGISMEEDELFLLAERFAIYKSGRSPRTAKQFIYSMLSKQ